MSQETAASRRNEFVGSFAKGLSVIRAFSAERRELTLAEVAEVAGQTRASARRFLLTLCELGYARAAGSRFSLTAKIVELGHPYLLPRAVGDIAQPLIEPVAARLLESASVAVLDGERVEIVAYARADRQMSVNLAPGDHLPLFTSAQGRVLLSGMSDDDIRRLHAGTEITPQTEKTRVAFDEHLEAVREARVMGYVLMDEELEVGVRSIAMPIRGQNGLIVGAMSTCAHANRASVERLKSDFQPILAETVAAIEARLTEIL